MSADKQVSIPIPKDISRVVYECKNEKKFSTLLKTFILKNKGLVLLYFSFMLMQPIRNVVLPHLLGKLYNKAKNNESIYWSLIGIIVLIVIVQTLSMFGDIVDITLQPNLQQHIINDIITHVFNVNKHNFNEQVTSQLLSRMRGLPATCFNFISQLKVHIFPSIISLLGVMIYLLWFDIKLGLLFILTCTFVTIIILSSYGSCDALSYECDQNVTSYFNNVDDIIKNMHTVLNMQSSDTEVASLITNFTEHQKVCTRTAYCVMFGKYLVIPIMIMFLCISTYYTYQKLQDNSLDSGQFVTLLILNFFILNTVFSITASMKDMIVRWGIIQSSLDVFEECTVRRIPYSKEAYVKTGIQVQDVKFCRFSKQDKTKTSNVIEHVVFDNLTLNIPAKQLTTITGKIGSGKSTLVSLILGNQTLCDGEIFIEGVPLHVAKAAGFNAFCVPQMPTLFNKTVYENVIYNIPDVDRNALMQKISHYGLEPFVSKLPDGLDTHVGVMGSRLSGGQRQIVWLMKLICLDPDVIILDEPTSSIDDESKHLIFTFIKKALRNKTIIVITHDRDFLQYSNHLIDLDKLVNGSKTSKP